MIGTPAQPHLSFLDCQLTDLSLFDSRLIKKKAKVFVGIAAKGTPLPMPYMNPMNIPPIGHANAAPIMAGISANSIFPIPIGIPGITICIARPKAPIIIDSAKHLVETNCVNISQPRIFLNFAFHTQKTGILYFF